MTTRPIISFQVIYRYKEQKSVVVVAVRKQKLSTSYQYMLFSVHLLLYKPVVVVTVHWVSYCLRSLLALSDRVLLIRIQHKPEESDHYSDYWNTYKFKTVTRHLQPS